MILQVNFHPLINASRQHNPTHNLLRVFLPSQRCSTSLTSSPVTSSLLSHVYPPASLLTQQRVRFVRHQPIIDGRSVSHQPIRGRGSVRHQPIRDGAAERTGADGAVRLGRRETSRAPERVVATSRVETSNTQLCDDDRLPDYGTTLTADELLDWQRRQIVQLQQLLQQSRLQLLVTQVCHYDNVYTH